MQKLLPTFLIGLTTASSSAAFATNLETCEKKLGIPPMLAHFAVPLEQVLYMPSVAVAFVATCLCMAENFGTAITPAWLLTMIVVTGLLSLAMPAHPRRRADLLHGHVHPARASPARPSLWLSRSIP